MSEHVRPRVVGIVTMLSSVIVVPTLCAHEGSEAAVELGGRDWTVQDSIAVRYLCVRQGYAAGTWPRIHGPDPVVRSPDGRYFFFMTYHGDLANDVPSFELRAYSAQAIEGLLTQGETRGVPQPLRSVEKHGYHNFATAIQDAHWSEDSASIIFSGVDADGPLQVFRLDIKTGDVARISDPSHDVFRYDFRGYGLVYSVGSAWRKAADALKYPTTIATSDVIQQSFGLLGVLPSRFAFYAAYNGVPAKYVGSSYEWTPPSEKRTWISPDGRFAIWLTATADVPIPRKWSAYDGLGALTQWDDPDDSGWKFRARRFMLIDMARGESHPIFDAPAGTGTLAGGATTGHLPGSPDVPASPTDVLWSPDGAHAIIVNTALPLEDGAPDREHMPYVIDFAPKTGTWSILEPMVRGSVRDVVKGEYRVQKVSWVTPGKELLITRESTQKGERAAMRYRLRAGHWIAQPIPVPAEAVKPTPPALRGRLTVGAREDANDPPTVVASDGKHEISLLGPDPALEGVFRGHYQEVQWTEENGRIVKGGLLLPRRPRDLGGVPLVIQAYHWLPDQFLPDGTSPTAFAAQTLAARGMAVLQMDIPIVEWENAHQQIPSRDRLAQFNYTDEGPSFVRKIDAAVQSLADKGIIDPERVGLIGFSRSGYMAYYAATHPGKTNLAAAIVADSWGGGFTDLVTFAGTYDNPDFIAESEQQYGSGTFWQNEASWLEQAPEFNMNSLRAPLLFMMTGPPEVSVVNALPTVGAFRASKHPYEVILFPYGQHQLKLPREREASLQASVDWMAFWLQGTAPADTIRAARWSPLRKLQDEVRKKPPQPKGKWIFLPEQSNAIDRHIGATK